MVYLPEGNMQPYYSEKGIEIYHGDCREVMRGLADCSVDAVVTDPPYELGFMGKSWDRSGIAYRVEVWQECLRVLKAGGHLLAFGGSRTYHRLACAIEDAGFEIRDQIQWIYGSGFPKSLDVSKAIDAAAGATRDVVGVNPTWREAKRRNVIMNPMTGDGAMSLTVASTDAAKQWDGWGTALKPAHEPLVLARKPIVGTVAENVLRHGTGGLNVDGCRVGTEEVEKGNAGRGSGHNSGTYRLGFGVSDEFSTTRGRWPANVIHDGSDEALAGFPDSEVSGSAKNGRPSVVVIESPLFGVRTVGTLHNDSGSAARFFYCAKASKEDRDEGCEGMPLQYVRRDDGQPNGMITSPDRKVVPPRANHHPTVKPTDLMRYLCRLVTPPNGTVLDPFCGSGSTGKAAVLERFNFIGIDLSAEYCELAEKRIEAVTRQGLLTFEVA